MQHYRADRDINQKEPIVVEVPLEVLGYHMPPQLNLANKNHRGLAFTLPEELYGEGVAPTYAEPSHLAAWLVGFWSGRDYNQAPTDNTNNNPDNV